jgi:REP element-mobilizing transposase RayT
MPDRRSPRHPAFDYRTPAAYFVTLCTHRRRPLFGTVRTGAMHLNALGRLALDAWRRSEAVRAEVVLDAVVVMPNHLHGIVCLVPPGADPAAVTPRGYALRVEDHLLPSGAPPVGTHGVPV